MNKIKDKQINIKYSFSLFSFLRRFAGIAVIVVLVLFLFKNNSKYEELLQLNSVVTEELQVSRNKEGEYVAKISAFETQRTEDFINFATKDSITLALQKEVRGMKRYLKKQGSVTNFSTEGNIETTSKTQVKTDEKGFPIYKSNFNLDNWVFGNSISTKDSTSYKIGYRDAYSLTIGVDPTGFLGLGPGKPFGQVTSSNPFNEVKTLKTYQVSLPKPKKFGLGIFAGSVVTGDFKIQPAFGIGVSYNLITF